MVEIFQDAQRGAVAPVHSTALDLPRSFDADSDVFIQFDFFGVKTDVQGDVMIRVYHMSSLGLNQMMFRLWFHTSFLEADQYWLDFAANALDASDSGSIVQDTAFPSDFKIRLLFEEPTTPAPITAALSASPPDR